MFKQYSKFIYYASLFEKYLGKKLYFAFILSLTAGLSESFGITMLFPLFSSLENGGIDVSSPQKIATSLISINKIVSFAANNTYISDPRVLAILFLVLAFSVKGILNFFALSYIALLKGIFLKDIKTKLFDFYSRMDYAYYLEKDTGYFTNLLNEQTNKNRKKQLLEPKLYTKTKSMKRMTRVPSIP